MIGFFDRIYKVNAAGVMTEVIGTSALNLKAISSSMRYAIVDHSIYKYSLAANTYSAVHNFTDNY